MPAYFKNEMYYPFLFNHWFMPYSIIFIKLVLVALIAGLFIVKLLMVSYYQQRSGDYFYNRMFNWYSKMEICNCMVDGRRNIMIRANRLNVALWVLSILLVIISAT